MSGCQMMMVSHHGDIIILSVYCMRMCVYIYRYLKNLYYSYIYIYIYTYGYLLILYMLTHFQYKRSKYLAFSQVPCAEDEH